MLKNCIDLERSVNYVCNKCPVEASYNVELEERHHPLHGYRKIYLPRSDPYRVNSMSKTFSSWIFGP
jgi:hypothetical protein